MRAQRQPEISVRSKVNSSEGYLSSSVRTARTARTPSPNFLASAHIEKKSENGVRGVRGVRTRCVIWDEQLYPGFAQILRSMGWDIDTAGHLTPAKEENHDG